MAKTEKDKQNLMEKFAEKPCELWAGVNKCWLSSICQTKFLPERYFFTREIALYLHCCTYLASLYSESCKILYKTCHLLRKIPI